MAKDKKNIDGSEKPDPIKETVNPEVKEPVKSEPIVLTPSRVRGINGGTR